MKNLVTLILLCTASFTATAQAGSLTVVNNIGCAVYYRIYGDANPSCNAVAASNFITLAAGGSVTYPDPTAVPGLLLGVTDYINGAIVYTARPFCTAVFSGNQVGEPCSGWAAVSPSYFVYNNSCSMCWAAFVQATWTPAASAGASATLTFN
jgi:hypothetical protein